jgi:hypothetical protein
MAKATGENAANEVLYKARLELHEYLRGELMAMMGIDIAKLSKEQLQVEMESITSVCDAVLEILAAEVVEIKDGKALVSLNLG